MFKTSTTIKTFATAALLATGSTAALAENAESFVHAGTTYSYVQTVEDGKRVITGRTSGGGRFRLVVSKNVVQGRFNGDPVRFGLSEVRPLTVAMR